MEVQIFIDACCSLFLLRGMWRRLLSVLSEGKKLHMCHFSNVGGIQSFLDRSLFILKFVAGGVLGADESELGLIILASHV